MEDRINASFTSENVAEVKATIDSLQGGLPFLQEFKPIQIAEMPKMGSKSLDFVQTALEGANVHIEELPRRFDVDGFRRDVELYQNLTSVKNVLEPIWRKINDTLIAVGADSYEESLEVYHSLKRASQGSGAEVYVDKLSKRFKYQDSGSSDTETTTDLETTTEPESE